MQTSKASKPICCFILALSVGCLIGGCSGSKSGPKTVRVTGKVTYKNAGVEGANVAFLGDGTIQPALAKTDKNGDFILTTSNPGDGAVPGVHQVTVTKSVGAPAAAPPTGRTSMDDALKTAVTAKDNSEPSVIHLIPEKYSQASTSQLSFTVEEGKTNHFEISLTD